ncbi:MAG TPA: hypothetical protein PKL31_11020 [Fulvivirga sp.]|nr:hypothetical protein [Fulvivirga sp.]
MKNYYFLVLVLAASFTTSVAQTSLTSIREELFYTEFNLDKCLSFYAKVKSYNQATPTVAAYEAAAKALIAKHSWNPVTKISSLKEAMDMLNKAVSLDEMNLEIRFLRLYIENSLPSYIGMKDDIDTDKNMIIKHIDLLDKMGLNGDIVNYILNYLSTSVACTTDEVKMINAFLF